MRQPFFTLLKSSQGLSSAPVFLIKFTMHVEYWHCVSVLQVEFEQFKDALILVLSSNEETLAKENPPRPGNIILCVSVLKFNDRIQFFVFFFFFFNQMIKAWYSY